MTPRKRAPGGTDGDSVLTLNAGSSSIKFALFAAAGDALRMQASGQVEGLAHEAVFRARRTGGPEGSSIPLEPRGPSSHRNALATILGWIDDSYPGTVVGAVGHRIVHGGTQFMAPVVIDDAVLDMLSTYIPLAPLHQPHNLAGVRAARDAFPDAIQVGCFDTAFHRQHPFVADTFALPRSFYEAGVRRYGFHGLSYEYIIGRLQEVAPREAAGGVIIAHLGSGASMCAVQNGRSVDSTMGFTALDGLPMGTRCGQLDPGVVLYLIQEKKLPAAEITDLLYNRSGLKGMSAVSNDMRVLERSPLPAAREAIDYFVARVRREFGGLAMALTNLDAIVFTGGIGERSATIREQVLRGLEWRGIVLDPEANADGREIASSRESKVKVLVLRTDEELMIARHTIRAARTVAPSRQATAAG